MNVDEPATCGYFFDLFWKWWERERLGVDIFSNINSITSQ